MITEEVAKKRLDELFEQGSVLAEAFGSPRTSSDPGRM